MTNIAYIPSRRSWSLRPYRRSRRNKNIYDYYYYYYYCYYYYE